MTPVSAVMDAIVASEHPNLNKDRVELFLAALESGGYAQCAGALRQQLVPLETMVPEERNCALGVAIHVALDNGLRADLETRFSPGFVKVIINNMFVRGALSQSVADWYGFDDIDPWLNWDQKLITVAGANDDGWTFWDIAQAGRAHWLKDQG